MSRTRKQLLLCTALILVLIAARIALGNTVRYYFISGAGYDDELLLEYARIWHHFHDPNYCSLLKTMSYPLFVAAIHAFHISFSTAMSLVWTAAALLFGYLVLYLFHNRAYAFFAFAYILFHPVGYTETAGLRVYRNVLIAPMVLMTFSALFLLYFHALRRDSSFLAQLSRSIVFSILLLFTYYIKEDGLWILASAAFFALVACLIALIRQLREKGKLRRLLPVFLCFALPFVTLFSGSLFYRAVNYRYFGVAEVQTRTSGELGRFASLVYRVDSPEQTYACPAPASSIQAVYDVSPTFQQHPKLLDAMFHSVFCDGDIEKNPIRGDFLTWVLRVALVDTDLWTSERNVSDMFARINQEISDAFASGKLKTSDKIRLLPSAPGRTPEEIRGMMPYVGEALRCAVTLSHYSTNIESNGTTDYADGTQLGIEMTELSYLGDYSFRDTPEYSRMTRSIDRIIPVYRLVNLLLIAAGAFALIGGVVLPARTHGKDLQKIRIFFAALVMLGISIAYAFAITWFAQFMMADVASAYPTLNFYTSALVSLLAFALFFLTGSLLPEGHKEN